MHTKPLALLLALLAFVSNVTAEPLKLADSGIVIDDGAKGTYTLRYPRPLDSNKKPIKVEETKIDGQTATLKFAGGGSSVVDVSSGAIVVKSSDLPDSTKQFQIAIVFPVKTIEGMTWNTGGEDLPFPKEMAPKVNISQGGQRTFTFKTAAGGKVAITLPAHGFQQLQDLRHFNGNTNIQWTAWMNHYPEAGSFTIQVGDAPAETPKAEAKPKAEATPRPEQPKAEMLKPATPAPQPTVAEGTDILKWKDGKKAAFYLSFDDACPSHLKTVIPELQKRKIVGTFYVIAGGGLFEHQMKKWTDAAATPYVVLANHTYNHKGAQTLDEFEQEVIKAREAINKATPQLKPDRLMSYGKPGGVKWGADVTDAAMKPILAKHNLVNRQPFWGAYTHVKTNADMEKIVDDAIKKGDVGHLDFHGVGGDWLPATMEFFTATLDKLDKHQADLWVTDHVTAHKYKTERGQAELKVLEKVDKHIKLSLATRADAALYDLPLTLTVKVPADWKSIQITQGDAKAIVEAKDGAAMFDATPGAMEILLTPAQ
jgi:peptidoglycan/xylan/chitin deacetylase (PgdA/CDA1 family)